MTMKTGNVGIIHIGFKYENKLELPGIAVDHSRFKQLWYNYFMYIEVSNHVNS